MVMKKRTDPSRSRKILPLKTESTIASDDVLEPWYSTTKKNSTKANTDDVMQKINRESHTTLPLTVVM